MRRWLICCGADSRPGSLDWLRRAAELRQPDGVLFAGGILSRSRHYRGRIGTCWGLTGEDARFIEKFFETMSKVSPFAAIIPGPSDTPLEDFLRMGMHAEVEFPAIHLAHATLVSRQNVAISGMGGRISDEAVCELDVYSRPIVEYYLRSLWSAKQPYRILLLSWPPPGPLGGPDGKSLVGDLINSYHPNLCAVGGPNECRGARRIAHTWVVNPGRLASGSAAFLDWSLPVPNQVEFLEMETAGAPAG